ncbi:MULTISPECIES: 7-carboxy-7-deazaguanine synthase [unclassified Hyphomonas]|uniref:7-carboxy-7-deazaguanine synthase n=1 Tax=unclassified Hyphomonas TaxID=2630699 RepID=UPI000458F850|nr:MULTISPECIES: 7-carboxy-7-deazaguanine synthase [unclassified Hyphomonas]KCZ45637.1 7-cyano-7-deazaguanine reductase [Hyphomonas sp. CY54-11-8]
MTYSVKEAFYTLQGEGAQTGRAAVFLRFAGCNLWSGLERDRTKAICQFCDTDFVGTDGENGGKYKTPEEVAELVASIWSANADTAGKPYVVCTGGEPLLQLDPPLIAALHGKGFEIAVETNGTIAAPDGLDWICVSPKANADLVLKKGNELKLVYPQDEPEAQPERFTELDFQHFFLQPKDNSEAARNVQVAAAYCLKNPQWRLSLQTHKLTGLP